MAESTTIAGIAVAGERLAGARSSRQPCPPVRGLLPAGDLDAAYRVQAEFVADRVREGARVVGRKVGLTNPAVQRQLGVDQPDFGTLLDEMDCSATGILPMDWLLQPRIEAEVAFVLGRDLTGDRLDVAAVVAATDHVVASFEIVDSRIAGWDISIVDTVADNASSGLFVLGAGRRRLDGIDLRECVMTTRRDGEVVSSGVGADCLGDPVAAVLWLARTVSAQGDPLRAGEVVLSGALGPVVAARPGDRFQATISGVGEVSARFDQGAVR